MNNTCNSLTFVKRHWASLKMGLYKYSIIIIIIIIIISQLLKY